MHTISRIAVTGGPCAGKSTGIPYLMENLSDRGFYPIVVPEAPTLLMGGNVSPTNGSMHPDDFEECVIRGMLNFEEVFYFAAQKVSAEKVVLLCDRGVMDALAYTTPEVFWRVCKQHGLDVGSACEQRYSGVIHLRTAALGAEEFYTCDNNPHRRETLAEAREMDQKTLAAWEGHPHIAIIGNEGVTFAQKLHCALQATCRVLGVPVPLEIEEKFLIEPISLFDLGIPHTVVGIEQIYLTPPAGSTDELRVRKRTRDGVSTYYETWKREVKPGVRVETERFISEEEYAWSLRYQKKGTIPIQKKRHCFTYKDQYFELDVFESLREGLHLLEIEGTEENFTIDIPPFIKVIRCVTSEKEFSNAVLALAA